MIRGSRSLKRFRCGGVPQAGALSYKAMVEDDAAIMSERSLIIDFSLPQIKSSLQEGSVIYEYWRSQCEIAPHRRYTALMPKRATCL